MRLGGPLFGDCTHPDQWIAELRKWGYRAAYAPVDHSACDELVGYFVRAAREAGIVIAEVGAWSNPMHPDETKRKEAIELCKNRLNLAERLGARCCVNIAGSRGEPWDGPDPKNLTEETFDLIVETTRGIIDAVAPKRTFFTLECMPWMYPDSPDSYLQLIKAIGRPQFAVHLDPVNLVCSPQRYFGNGALIRECVEKLGQYIKSCHAKDIALASKLTTHLDEVRLGLGGLDYRAYLRELNKLDPDLPLMLEHLPAEEDYRQAAAHVRAVAKEEGIDL